MNDCILLYGATSGLSVNDCILLYGVTSGLDSGGMVEVDVSKRFGGKTLANLYRMSGIDYTDGDSGAPIIGAWKKAYLNWHMPLGCSRKNGFCIS